MACQPDVTTAISRPNASPDPHDGDSPPPNPIHSSSGVTTTIGTLTRLLSSDPQSAPTLSLIIEQIERYFRGHSPCADLWLPYPLSPQGLDALKELIRENSHWGDKLRYHYFRRTSTFILAMAGSIQHETLEEWFCKFVECELRQLCSGDPAKESFADQIDNERQAPIEDGEIGSHSPDAQFRHLEAQHPGVILEVAYAQKSEALPELAHIYITKGHGSTRLIVALDQDYRRSKQIVLKTWRPRIEPSSSSTPAQLLIEHHSQELRSHDGKPVPGSQLRIRVVDFAPQDLIPESLHNESIVISSEKFCHYLYRREQSHEMKAAKRGRVYEVPSPMACPPRPSSLAVGTPSDDDEADGLEASAIAREERIDGD